MIKIMTLLLTSIFLSGCIISGERNMVKHHFDVPVQGNIDFGTHKIMCQFRGGYKKELKLKEQRKDVYIFSGSEYLSSDGGWIFFIPPSFEFNLSGDA